MAHYTKQDIKNMVAEQDVEFIRLQFTDIFGNIKTIAATTSQLDKVLENRCMFDGSSIEGLVRVEESDMFLYPDLDTFEILPWRPQMGRVARFICDVYRPDGTPFEGDARYILRRLVQEVKELGYTFRVGPECEFFLFDLEENSRPSTKTSEVGGYFDVAPLDSGENARREMILAMEEMNCVVEASHHELSPAQHEITLGYGEPMTTADNIITFKMAARTIARRHGLHASFMPKPKDNVNGSGMHINISLWKDGKNVFADEAREYGLSEEALHFIAGVLKHVEGMSLITNPLVNSYKRLVPGFEAPVYIAWSVANRSPLIRIPATASKDKRMELRFPDSAANPYLALTVCLAAGMEGLKNQMKAPDSVNQNIFAMDQKTQEEYQITRLPATLKDAIKAFRMDVFLQSVLGSHISEKYLEAKTTEWEEYNCHVTEWELQRYLDRI